MYDLFFFFVFFFFFKICKVCEERMDVWTGLCCAFAACWCQSGAGIQVIKGKGSHCLLGPTDLVPAK